MQKLNYFRPQTLSEALQLMQKHAGSIKPYAGGTDLMVQLREGAKRLSSTQYLLDLGALEELKGIKVTENLISIGCMASHASVAASAQINSYAQFLAAACLTVGSPQIRNLGTVGGNICNGSPAADSLSPFVALDASLVIEGSKGQRKQLVKDVYAGASKVNLEDDEIATRIEFKRMDEYSNAFIKLGRRKALAISRMNAAAMMNLTSGIIKDARIVPGCVFSIPDRLTQAEQHIEGKTPSRQLFEECGKMASAEMIKRTGVRWSTEYKQPVVEAMVYRALCQAAAIAEE